MAKKYRSEVFASIHETIETLHEEGIVDTPTMRDFDKACLASSKGRVVKSSRTARRKTPALGTGTKSSLTEGR